MNQEKFFLTFALAVLMLISVLSLGKIYDVERRIIAAEAEFAAEEQAAIEEYNQQRGRIVTYLKKRGGVYPDVVADACMATSRPELCAAQALKESTANPYCLPGDGGASHGGWQVQPRWWGRVSADPYRQARQNQMVMDALLMRYDGNAIDALADYNGGPEFGAKSQRYAAAVLNHAAGMR